MIDKFNFYEIYRYFLPGLMLLGVLWLPFGLVQHSWPTTDWSAAIIGAAFAYALGHLLEMIARDAISSSATRDKGGRERHPSEVLLDPAHNRFSAPVKDKLASCFRDQFGLELAVDEVGTPEIDRRRNNAFVLARQTLVPQKAASYAEQFEGMYAVVRALISLLGVACAYWLGWAAAALRASWSPAAAIICVVIALLLVVNTSFFPVSNRVKVVRAWSYLALLAALGYCAGLRYEVTSVNGGLLALLALVALAGARRAYEAYPVFVDTFAITVWLEYLAYAKAARVGEKNPALTNAETS